LALGASAMFRVRDGQRLACASVLTRVRPASATMMIAAPDAIRLIPTISPSAQVAVLGHPLMIRASESIEIGPYLSKLCDSLAKSMIGDRRPLSIRVQATSGAATSSAAVSLGLIVTELVINALKHAFSSGEAGEILVSYDPQGSGWRLSVSDNGTGPGDASAERPHIGLGTSIVEALARQLDATVQKSSGPQGTTVSIVAGAAAGGS